MKYKNHPVKIIDATPDGGVIIQTTNGSRPFLNLGSRPPYWIPSNWTTISRVEMDVMVQAAANFQILLKGSKNEQ